MASNNMSPLRNFLNSIKNSVYNISIDGIGNTDINASSLFNGFPNLYRTITLNDMNYITNMSKMFNNTKNLSQIPNYNFNTSNVTNISWMFQACYNLTNIPNFDTSKVTNMWYTFSSCSNLTNVPNFNTSNVTYMAWMFFQCYNLITIPNFNTSKVTNMTQMFQHCDNLINVPNFDTSNVTNMSQMFKWCYNLTTIPNFNTSKVIDMYYMFNGCWNLTNIPILNITNLINMSSIFSYCDNLSQASVNNIVTSCSTASKVTNKNWTDIGFNVAANSQWNTWIRTAPDYMNAVNIGWQNIGDAIKSDLYKRRIMVGDNLTGKNIYFEPYDLNEFGNYCRNIYYKKKPENTMDIFSFSVSNITDIVYENFDTFNIKDSSYVIEGPYGVSNLTNIRLYVYNSNGASILSNCFKINNNTNVIVENITHKYPHDNNEPVGDDTSYRAFYIEDENIRPLEVGDIIGPGTKFYFTFPDNLAEVLDWDGVMTWELYTCTIGDSTDEKYFMQFSSNPEYVVYQGDYIFGEFTQFYYQEKGKSPTKNYSVFECPSSNELIKITSVKSGVKIDKIVQYILVDTRTLYKNPEVGDILTSGTFYFKFPEDLGVQAINSMNPSNYEDILTWHEKYGYSHIKGSIDGANYEISFGGNLNNLIYKSNLSNVSINENQETLIGFEEDEYEITSVSNTVAQYIYIQAK